MRVLGPQPDEPPASRRELLVDGGQQLLLLISGALLERAQPRLELADRALVVVNPPGLVMDRRPQLRRTLLAGLVMCR